jgi:hypothetical protein
MMVLVDTSVWSVALRRQAGQLTAGERAVREELAELIREGRARLIGPVRQELLSGIRTEAQYQRLRQHLRAFPDPQLAVEDYEEAAQANNRCRAQGAPGSAIDFLICAIAMRRNWPIFTTDRDFVNYARVLPVSLYSARGNGDGPG